MPSYSYGSPQRVIFLDELRGLCILLMVAYHGAYDLVYLFGVNIPIFHAAFFDYAQPLVAGTFIVISGIAARYSKNNIKRGCIALGIGLAMTAFTWYFMREQAILFGILHLLGTSMILFGLTHRSRTDKVSGVGGLLIAAALYLFTIGVPRGYIGAPFFRIPLPAAMYGTRFLFPFGFPGPSFASADYFPLVPWMFLFFAGAYLGLLFRANMMPGFFYRSHIPALSKVGRHSLIIYILHQPVLYGVLTGLFFLLEKMNVL